MVISTPSNNFKDWVEGFEMTGTLAISIPHGLADVENTIRARAKTFFNTSGAIEYRETGFLQGFSFPVYLQNLFTSLSTQYNLRDAER